MVQTHWSKETTIDHPPYLFSHPRFQQATLQHSHCRCPAIRNFPSNPHLHLQSERQNPLIAPACLEEREKRKKKNRFRRWRILLPLLSLHAADSLLFVPDWMVGSISIETLQRKRLHLGSTNRKFLMKVGQSLAQGGGRKRGEREREREKRVDSLEEREKVRRRRGGRARQGNLWHLVTTRHKKEEGQEGVGWLFVAAFN